MKDTKEWSRDWEHFDWNQVREEISKAEERAFQEGRQVNGNDVSMSGWELKEFFEWLYDTHPEMYYKVVLYMQLVDVGMPHEEAQVWINRPEELKRALENLF